MEPAAACTAFLALRTGTAQLGDLVSQLSSLHEESLFKEFAAALGVERDSGRYGTRFSDHAEGAVAAPAQP
ncbi:hypothetical protein ACH4GK_23415 [Streptomyces rimosus]|uniref:hypothetical protein n=1 Tax=Streptomyces rimosus TaxID=1927 RepID=UPI00131EA42C|nr:hypothetical protein [Streptomyces rimosus]